MNEELLRVFSVRIRPELHAFGTDLVANDIEEVVNELGENVRVGRHTISINQQDKLDIINYALTEFGLGEVAHVHQRGGGFYRDGEQTVLEKENWSFYHKHRNFISDHVYPNLPNVVESIDFETDQIIKKIPNPSEQGNETFLNKGLVIGYVQSGKTANFTHLISKAASIGYKFIIVLGGMTNTLRSQTQFRLDKELTGINHYGHADVPYVSWGADELKYSSLSGAPNISEAFDGDFHIPVANFSDHFAQTNNATLAIIKKLARNGENFGSVLGRLIRWIENRNNPEAEMPPVLIIDDEADQAGIDGGIQEAEPTTINHAIRHLMSLFPQLSYVGYTATPFANVFIDADSTFNGLPDLYPEDFIYSLPEPMRYFGAKQFFGTTRIIGDHEDLFYVENVPDDEKEIINDPLEEITESLVQAFWDFVFSVIIRRERGDNNHCGFMVHTDHRNIYHDSIKFKIEAYLRISLDKLEMEDANLINHVYDNWERYIRKSDEIGRTSGFAYILPTLDRHTLIEKVINVLGGTQIKIVNGLYENLDYNTDDLDTLICIGGNLMSRGVTIEGLTVSYYLRDALKYDTLLQMGRWFGYRIGYEDLLRVYTTQRIEEHFEYVMGVETDLRNEINRYQEERLTPRDFAPRVRAHMTMLPSGRMGAATRARSYSRQSPQTIYMDRNIEVLRNNNSVVENLINNCFQNEIKEQGNYNISDIEINYLQEFLTSFQTPNHEIAGFDIQDVIRYLNIRVNSNEISHFDLKLAGRNSLRQGSEVDVINNQIELYPAVRSARTATGWNKIGEGIVNIGVISDSNDMPNFTDPNVPQITKPLLIIYSIDRVNSNSFKQGEMDENGQFIPSNDIIDGLDFNPKGFALVFPRSNIAEGEYDYYQQIMRD
jgi:hypothetical protein